MALLYNTETVNKRKKLYFQKIQRISILLIKIPIKIRNLSYIFVVKYAYFVIRDVML